MATKKSTPKKPAAKKAPAGSKNSAKKPAAAKGSAAASKPAAKEPATKAKPAAKSVKKTTSAKSAPEAVKRPAAKAPVVKSEASKPAVKTSVTINTNPKNMAEFWPFYLYEHRDPVSRNLHFIGTTLVVALLLVGVLSWNPVLFILLPVVGYGFAWVGHFFYERNTPATFRYPLMSLASDFRLWYHTLRGTLNDEYRKYSIPMTKG